MKLSEFKASQDLHVYLDKSKPKTLINWYIEITKDGKIVKCFREQNNPEYSCFYGIGTNLNLYVSIFTEKKEDALEFAKSARQKLIKENKWNQ